MPDEPIKAASQAQGGHQPTQAEPADEPTMEGAEPAADPQHADGTADQGKAARLEQEISKYNRVFEALGIDPESDVADRVLAGVMTKDDLVRMVAPQHTQQPPREMPKPEPTPYEKLNGLIQKAKSEGATEDDFAQALDVMASYIKGQEDVSRQATVQQKLDMCKQSVYEVIRHDELHQALPQELQQLEEDLFLASTDHLVGREAQRSGNPDQYFSPQVFGFYANRNAERLDQLRNFWIEHGKKLARPANPQAPVQPISSSAGGAPVGAPAVPITRSNLRDMAKAYLQSRSAR